jgi:hypothetical protein
MQTTTIEELFTGDQQMEIWNRTESANNEDELRENLKEYFLSIKQDIESKGNDPVYLSYAIAHVLKKEGVTL